MGRRTLEFDWSQTALGPIETWPQSLRTAVRIMLDSRYAMWLGWGPDLIFFYNDAYASMTLGPKHPWALGRAASEVWSEIWTEIGPRAKSVLEMGKATWDEGLLLFLERSGNPEETYHTFSYSPVPDDAGHVGGLLCVVTEDTKRTIGERRLRTLRELAARTTDESDSAEVACRTACRILDGNPQDIPFAIIYLVEPGGRQALLAGTSGFSGNFEFAPESINLQNGDDPWRLQTIYAKAHDSLVVALDTKSPTLPAGPWSNPPHRAIVLPLSKPGQSQVAGMLVSGISARLTLDDDYRGFFDLLSGQIASSVASARAYEEERRRAQSLAELDRAKTTFFSNVSHEFRTPLTLMLGPIEDLLQESGRSLPTQFLETLQTVHRNGLRLQRLVNALLDFSRIEAGRVQAEYRPTDLAAFTSDLASVFRAAIEKAGMRFIVDCHPIGEFAYIDRDMWEKIVFNLLSNAFKYTMQGEIAVALRKNGKQIELLVSDTGIGIAEEEMPRLFERFHRIRGAQSRTLEGTGIGLALVQELIKLHGGWISAESVPGKGTTFLVSIPLGHAHLPRHEVSQELSDPLITSARIPFFEEAMRWSPDENPTPWNVAEIDPSHESKASSTDADQSALVLVVDDNADMRGYVARLLRERFHVREAVDGIAALKAMEEQLPSLILTDVMMPRLDGFGLLRELRASERTREIPVIMLSARAGEESIVDGMEAGADDYLVKPFSARELIARVTAHLQMSRLRKEAALRERTLLETVQSSEERFRRAADAVNGIIYEYDLASNSVIRTRGLREVMGYDPEQVPPTATWWGEQIHPDDRPQIDKISLENALRTQQGITAHYRIRHRDGRWLHVEDRAIVLGDDEGRPTKVIGCTVDISERKAAEQALLEADRRKDEFLATLAHELRNPLAPMRNALGILDHEASDTASLELARQVMRRQLEQMVRLIDDLLDLGRISGGRIELRKERIDLVVAIQNAIETSRPLLDEFKHEFRVAYPESPVFVEGDRARLSQVFSNLLNNAARYTPQQGRVVLSIEKAEDHAVISINDNGVGIPEEMLERIFDMFTQVDRSLQGSRDGLGIGLTLVKRLVHKHGGTVTAQSDGRGRGSRFVVRLPLAKSQVTETSLNQSRTKLKDSKSRRILVVDDNIDSATSLAMMLKIMGHESFVAHDGVEAVEKALAIKPNLILMDVGMPKMNGYDATRLIRTSLPSEVVHIAALTGWGQDDDRRQSAEAGCDSHLVKPVKLDDLKSLLANLPSVATA